MCRGPAAAGQEGLGHLGVLARRDLGMGGAGQEGGRPGEGSPWRTVLCFILSSEKEGVKPVHVYSLTACSLRPQGTVIRVFSIPEGQKLFEFRRGVKR